MEERGQLLGVSSPCHQVHSYGGQRTLSGVSSFLPSSGLQGLSAGVSFGGQYFYQIIGFAGSGTN